MGTSIDPAVALFGRARREILALLLGRPAERFHLREIMRSVNGGNGAIQRELALLSAAGLLRRDAEGNQVYFSANPESPIFPDLRRLIDKTAGLTDVLRASLARPSLAKRISLAFVYGSGASGDLKPSSDIDLLLVGDIDLSDIVPVIRPAQERLGREINPTIYPEQEFRDKLSKGTHFLRRVVEGPKLFLIGNDRVLEDLAKQRLAGRASDEHARDVRSLRRRRS